MNIIGKATTYPQLRAILAARRKQLGLSQEAASERAGLPARYLNKIECGMRHLGDMSFEVVLALLDIALIAVDRSSIKIERSADCGRANLLRQLKELLPGHSQAALDKIVEREERARRARTTGSRPVAHTKARHIARLYDAYKAACGGGPVKTLARKFLAALPAHLHFRPNAKSRGKEQPSKTLSNTLTFGRELNIQRPTLRRLVAALKRQAPMRLPSGSPNDAMRQARAAVFAGRSGRRKDRKEIAALAALEEYRAWTMERLLLGDAADGMFKFNSEK